MLHGPWQGVVPHAVVAVVPMALVLGCAAQDDGVASAPTTPRVDQDSEECRAWWSMPGSMESGRTPASSEASSALGGTATGGLLPRIRRPSSPELPSEPSATKEAPMEMTSLHCAVYRLDQAAVDRLLASGQDPDEPDWRGSGDTPLMQAVTSGHLGIVRSLCAAGCSVDTRRVNGQTALMLCIVSRASRRSPRLLLSLLEALLAAGADPGVREKLRGQTALHALVKVVAAEPRDAHLLTALRLLARATVNDVNAVNAQDHRRRTALHHLASRGCTEPEPYQILLEARADPSLQNARGDTPLVDFLEREGTATPLGEEVVHLLAGSAGSAWSVDAGRPGRHVVDVVGRRTQYGETALHVAARRNRAVAVRVALAAGVDPCAKDLNGNTALHLAASRGYSEVVSLLLAAPGCQVNAVNRDGYSALHVAVESGFVEVVNTLLGADGVEVGQSALELAQQEYRLRAQPQLARTLAAELDRRLSVRLSRFSLGGLSLSSSSSDKPESACSIRPASATPTVRRSPSILNLGEDEHPINYLGAQVSCTARIRPRYSSEDAGDVSCRDQKPEQPRTMEPTQQVQQVQQVPRRSRSVAVDVSLREANELMQKFCDEDLSFSPPADWSPPTPRTSSRTSTTPSELSDCTDPWTRRSTRPISGDSGDHTQGQGRRSKRDSEPRGRQGSGPRGRFHLPANPFTTVRARVPVVGADEVDAASEDASDLLVESLLAVAKSITEPPAEPEHVDVPDVDFDRTGVIPKDYELFERSVLFGGSGGAAGDDRVLSRTLAGTADTAIASR